ncbi:MAG TPA: biotin/lipoyl-containing protein [Thermoanaerobaculia bacterium]|nr:biotin/lipoyl-containing protein [Thermoanaerobaculia bacterium]
MSGRSIGWIRGSDVEALEVPAGAEVETRDGEIREVSYGGRRTPVRTARAGETIFVWCGGDVWEFTAAPAPGRAGRSARDDAGLRAPMPGRIVRLLVSEGETVTRGTTLLVLEAMKMEHEIKAPHDGTVARLPYLVGDQVDAGAPLVEFAG